MKRLLGSLFPLAAAVLLLTALAACDAGDTSGPEAGPPASASPSAPDVTGPPEKPSPGQSSPGQSSPGQSSPGQSSPGGQGRVIAILSESDTGGSVEDRVTPLDDAAAVDAYVAQFSGPTMADQIRDAVGAATPGPDEVVVAAVVLLSCDVPGNAAIEPGLPLRLVATELPTTGIQCLVPVTSVALAVVHVDALR